MCWRSTFCCSYKSELHHLERASHLFHSITISDFPPLPAAKTEGKHWFLPAPRKVKKKDKERTEWWLELVPQSAQRLPHYLVRAGEPGKAWPRAKVPASISGVKVKSTLWMKMEIWVGQASVDRGFSGHPSQQEESRKANPAHSHQAGWRPAQFQDPWSRTFHLDPPALGHTQVLLTRDSKAAIRKTKMSRSFNLNPELHSRIVTGISEHPVLSMQILYLEYIESVGVNNLGNV